MVKCCVLFEVRTESLNIIRFRRVKYRLKNRYQFNYFFISDFMLKQMVFFVIFLSTYMVSNIGCDHLL
jgi:hypothetical protein